MTKKHFESLAFALGRAYADATTPAQTAGVGLAHQGIEAAIREHGPRFDVDRFRARIIAIATSGTKGLTPAERADRGDASAVITGGGR